MTTPTHAATNWSHRSHWDHRRVTSLEDIVEHNQRPVRNDDDDHFTLSLPSQHTIESALTFESPGKVMMEKRLLSSTGVSSSKTKNKPRSKSGTGCDVKEPSNTPNIDPKRHRKKKSGALSKKKERSPRKPGPSPGNAVETPVPRSIRNPIMLRLFKSRASPTEEASATATTVAASNLSPTPRADIPPRRHVSLESAASHPTPGRKSRASRTSEGKKRSKTDKSTRRRSHSVEASPVCEKSERRKSRRRKSTSCNSEEKTNDATKRAEANIERKWYPMNTSSSQLQPIKEVSSIASTPSPRQKKGERVTLEAPQVRRNRRSLDRSLSVPDLTPRGKNVIKTLRESLEEYISSHSSPQADRMVEHLRMALDETVVKRAKSCSPNRGSSQQSSQSERPPLTHKSSKRSSQRKQRSPKVPAHDQESNNSEAHGDSASSLSTEGHDSFGSEPLRRNSSFRVENSSSASRLQTRTNVPRSRRSDEDSASGKLRDRSVDFTIDSWEEDMNTLFRKWGLQRRDSSSQLTTTQQRMSRQNSAQFSHGNTKIKTPSRSLSLDERR